MIQDGMKKKITEKMLLIHPIFTALSAPSLTLAAGKTNLFCHNG